MNVFGALKAERRHSNSQAMGDHLTALVAKAIVVIAGATVVAAAYAEYHATSSNPLVPSVYDTAGRL